MSLDARQPTLKTPTNPASASAGPSVLSVVVESVDPTGTPPYAVCKDPAGRPIQVRMDFQRGKGSIPAVNERWVIDQSMGFWTFACYQLGDPTGGSSISGTHAVAGLDETLDAQQAALDDTTARLDEMWTLATVTAAPAGGATADVRLSDGTTLGAIPVLGTYAPSVGETVWTARADGGGSRIVVGPSAVITADSYGFKGDYYTLNVRGNSTLAGTLAVTGAVTLSSTLAITGAITGAGAVLSGRLTSGDLVTAGWYAGPSSSSGSPAWMAYNQNVGIVGLNGILYVSQYGDSSLRADLIAATITATGPMNANGFNTSSIQVGAAGTPTDRQIRTFDLTATNNINVLNTFFYKGVAQNMNPASERELKTDISELDDPFGYLDHLVPSRFRYIDTEHFDNREHVGVMVNEMAEADESTVIYPVTIPRGMADDEVVERAWANHGRVPDERALIAYLVRAVQLLNDRLKRFESPVDPEESAGKE